MILILPLVITLVFFLIGMLMLRNIFIKKKLCINKTEATIVDYIKKYERDNDGNRIDKYFFIYEYYIGKKKHMASSSITESYPMYEVGNQIELMYNPENPSQHYILGEEYSLTMIVGGIICIILGGGFSLFLIYLLINEVKNDMIFEL